MTLTRLRSRGNASGRCSTRLLLEARHQISEHRSRTLPPIVAILKLLHVLLKVLPGNVNVRPTDQQLQPRPKTLNPVNVQ